MDGDVYIMYILFKSHHNFYCGIFNNKRLIF